MTFDIEKRLLLTLSYTEQFLYPLTTSELFLRLITAGVPGWDSSDLKTRKKIFIEAIGNLSEKKLVNYYQKMFFINNSELVNIRKKREFYSNEKLREAKRFVKVASFLPFITGILVTGSLAVNNAKKDDDIDFMIVTQKSRLWLSRIILVLFATLMGKRRSFAKEEKNSWCFNLWVEESDMGLPVLLRSIYEAHEVVQAKWLLNRGDTKTRFFKANAWAKKFLPGIFLFQKNRPVYIEGKRPSYFTIASELITFLNWIFYKAQLIYMKPHITREKVGKSHAFFHPRDTKQQILINWKRSLKNLTTRNSVKTTRQKVVLVTGVFDVLHQEHLNFLKKARVIGEVLIVAIESDARVRKIKGEGRPIHLSQKRVENLKKLKLADEIVVLPERFDSPNDHQKFIKKINPDFLAVSSHTAHLDKKRSILKKIGGEVVIVHQRNPKISTTKIIKHFAK